jgi:hypothetical protein
LWVTSNSSQVQVFDPVSGLNVKFFSQFSLFGCANPIH